MKTSPILIIAVLAIASANRPSAPSWLQGTWRADPERTKEEGISLLDEPINQNQSQKAIWAAEVKRVNLAADLKDYGHGDPFNFVVSAHQASIFGHYTRETDQFIVSKVSSDQCTLRFARGMVQTYHRDGDEIFVLSDTSDLRIYYQRIP